MVVMYSGIVRLLVPCTGDTLEPLLNMPGSLGHQVSAMYNLSRLSKSVV